MSFQIPGFLWPRVAGGNLSVVGPFIAVILDSAGDVVVPTVVTELAIGVVQNNPISGEEATIMSSGITKMVAGEPIAIGVQVGITATTGRGSTAVTTEGVIGVALETATADGDIIAVKLIDARLHV